MNLSAKQLVGRTLARSVAAALSNAGMEASELCLEVTESVLMDKAEERVGSLLELRDLGVELAIDDFGTGYSSLAYLRRLPINIQRSTGLFVGGLGASDEDGRSVRAIISLAHKFGLRVVAEGVETELQYEIISVLGCDMAQGYLISPPVTPEQTLVALEPRPRQP